MRDNANRLIRSLHKLGENPILSITVAITLLLVLLLFIYVDTRTIRTQTEIQGPIQIEIIKDGRVQQQIQVEPVE